MKATTIPLALAMTLVSGVALAQHPLVPPYAKSDLVKQDFHPAKSYRLLVHPLENPSSSSPEHKETYTDVSGKWWRVVYQAPSGKPVSDVYHYYEAKLQSEDFEILYNCAGQTCSPGSKGASFNEAMAPADLGDKMRGKVHHQRYLAAKLRRAEGDVYVSLYATRADAVNNQNDNPVYCNIIVVETPTNHSD
jgi:hypothetical protein